MELLYKAQPVSTFELLLDKYGGDRRAELRATRRDAYRAMSLSLLISKDLAEPSEVEEAGVIVNRLAADDRWWARGLAYSLARHRLGIIRKDKLQERLANDTYFGPAVEE